MIKIIFKYKITIIFIFVTSLKVYIYLKSYLTFLFKIFIMVRISINRISLFI